MVDLYYGIRTDNDVEDHVAASQTPRHIISVAKSSYPPEVDFTAGIFLEIPNPDNFKQRLWGRATIITNGRFPCHALYNETAKNLGLPERNSEGEQYKIKIFPG